MDVPHGSVGSAIKKARLAKGLTQEKLAELIGITPMHIKQLESERRNPSSRVLLKLVNAIDLPLGSIFSDSDNEMMELKEKINLCLDRCDVHELQIAYATLEALLKKPE